MRVDDNILAQEETQGTGGFAAGVVREEAQRNGEDKCWCWSKTRPRHARDPTRKTFRAAATVTLQVASEWGKAAQRGRRVGQEEKEGGNVAGGEMCEVKADVKWWKWFGKRARRWRRRG